MNILIGGCGNLGKFIYRELFLEKLINPNLISIRHSNFDDFKRKFYQLNKKDVFIDLMDPNDVNDFFEIATYEKSIAFRNFALQNSSEINYIYLLQPQFINHH